MEKHDLLKNNSVLIIEPNPKDENDKTFCFWAEEKNSIAQDFELLISNKWPKIKVNDNTPLAIEPLIYYHINSKDLYDHTKLLLEKRNVKIIDNFVENIYFENSTIVETTQHKISCDWVFDCRPIDFKSIINNKFYISQSFIGYKIKLKQNSFKQDVYHMMDFRVSQENATQFVYILPYDKQTGLIELTRFGKEILDENEAASLLNEYINKHYGEYEIIDKERGVIPMSSLLPSKDKIKNCINIGTRGGSVKPSTGYAFKNMYEHAKLICSGGRIKPKKIKAHRRFLFYDQLLLIILSIWPSKGKGIFERLFKYKTPNFILKFLDEKTTLMEEISMFSKLQIGIFLKATVVWVYWRLKPLIVTILMIIYAAFSENQFSTNNVFFSALDFSVIISGLLLIGIPHGALDHLTESLQSIKKVTFKFVAFYIALMIPIYLIWIFFPSLGLILFLVYSAWHFGQTDFENWNIKMPFFSLLWGVTILMFLFASHPYEFNYILDLINIKPIDQIYDLHKWAYFILIWPLLMALIFRKTEWLLLILFFVLSQNLGLLVAFGLYFIFHHSVKGWFNLKEQIKMSHYKMYINALPFNVGALVLYILIFSNSDLEFESNAAWFFVFLSCISFPHVICMNLFYRKKSESSIS